MTHQPIPRREPSPQPARRPAQRGGGGATQRPAEGRDRDSRPRRLERPFTIAQAARVLGTSPQTVRRLLREGRIAHELVSPRRTVIPEEALRAYIDSVTVEARP